MQLGKIIRILSLLSLLLVSTLHASKILEKVEIKKGVLRLYFNQAYNQKHITHTVLNNPYRERFTIPHTRLKNASIGKNLHAPCCKRIKIEQHNNSVRIILYTHKRHYHFKTYRPWYAYNAFFIPLPPMVIARHHIVSSKKKSTHTTHSISKEHNTITPITTVSIQEHTFTTQQKQKQQKKTTYSPPKKEKSTSTSHKQRSHTPSKITSPKITPSTPIHYSGYRGNDLIVIDAGHGGHDSGAIGGKHFYEKNLVLQIAKRLAKKLKQNGFRVYLTRSNDHFLKLSQRTHIAEQKHAKLFISIHANAVPKNRHKIAHGIATYYLDTAHDAKAKRIAARENASILQGSNKKEKDIILSTIFTGPKQFESHKFASSVQKHIIKNLRKHYNWIKNDGAKAGPFYVLVGASLPSILIETGYITHPKERKRLFSPAYQKRMVEGIVEGVKEYLFYRKQEID